MSIFKNLLINTAIEAGNAILEIYNSNFNVTYKIDNSPLTLADLKANEIILKKLTKTKFPVISEESVTEIKNINVQDFWLIDPIDGTKQFVKSDPEFTVNIAFIKSGYVKESVVFAPALNLMYYGNISGSCLKINTITNKVTNLFDTKNVNKQKIVVLTSKSRLNDKTIEIIKKIKNNLFEVEQVSIGSSLKFCYLADATGDIYIRIGEINTWDIAAGHAILKSAGGNVYDLEAFEEISYKLNNHILGNFIAFRNNELLEKIRPILT